jgi:hypothetical protein
MPKDIPPELEQSHSRKEKHSSLYDFSPEAVMLPFRPFWKNQGHDCWLIHPSHKSIDLVRS